MRPTDKTRNQDLARRQGDHSTLYVSLELSRSSWLVTSLSPNSDKMSKHSIAAGDAPRTASSKSADHPIATRIADLTEGTSRAIKRHYASSCSSENTTRLRPIAITSKLADPSGRFRAWPQGRY
jgi:hypothetical protein